MRECKTIKIVLILLALVLFMAMIVLTTYSEAIEELVQTSQQRSIAGRYGLIADPWRRSYSDDIFSVVSQDRAQDFLDASESSGFNLEQFVDVPVVSQWVTLETVDDEDVWLVTFHRGLRLVGVAVVIERDLFSLDSGRVISLMQARQLDMIVLSD